MFSIGQQITIRMQNPNDTWNGMRGTVRAIFGDGTLSVDLPGVAPDVEIRPSETVEYQAAQRQALACHYCGQPAKRFGFFDEPICEECAT